MQPFASRLRAQSAVSRRAFAHDEEWPEEQCLHWRTRLHHDTFSATCPHCGDARQSFTRPDQGKVLHTHCGHCTRQFGVKVPPLHLQTSVPEGEVANELRGVFLKRHGTTAQSHRENFGRPTSARTSQERWAKRYVSVDDHKGRLTYSARGANGKPSLALPLQDITNVHAVPPSSTAGPCLVVTCPPHTLVVQTESEETCSKWVGSIGRRVEHWKGKAEGMVAAPVFGVPAGSAPTRCWSIGSASSRAAPSARAGW